MQHNFDQNSHLQNLFEALMMFCSAFPIVYSAVLVVAPLLRKTYRRFNLFMLVVGLQAISEVAKFAISQPRPAEACSRSLGFPSGHSANAVALMTFFLLEKYFYHERNYEYQMSFLYKLGYYIIVLFAPLVPLSRYYLRYHTLFQIVGGCLLGLTYAPFLFFYLLNQQNQKGSPVNKLLLRLKFRNNYVLVNQQEAVALLSAKSR